ncbi:MAG: GDSL-type esterase/lipase family protein [Candidatus Omnitrophota bacterium]
MQDGKQKITALILGILVSLVVLEVSLRVIGIVYSHQARDARAFKKEPGTFVILCFGDSFTEGMGAPRGRGYPAQLAELFQKKYPGKKVRVVNKGIGGYNTAMILERFDESINEVNPDVITILAGGANRWNAYGYGDYLNRNGWVNRLNNWLYKIKIFKLARLFMFDLQNKKEHLLDSYVFPTPPAMSPDAEEWRKRGGACERAGKYDEAISWYEKIVEKYPSALGGYEFLRNVYFKTGNREGERRMLRKLIELDPKRPQLFFEYIAMFLIDPAYNKEDFQFMQGYANAMPVVRDALKRVTEMPKYYREMKGWINHDIEEMIRRAHRRGIKVILQTYPYYDKGDEYESLSFINQALRGASKKKAVLFIDNEWLFDQFFLKGANRDDYFESAKAHCNEKGYGVMAKNIYCGIIASNGLGILPAVEPAEKSKCLEL